MQSVKFQSSAAIERITAAIVPDTLSAQARLAISTAHRAAEVDNPCVSPVVKITLKGISRTHGQLQVQASALNAVVLDTIRATALLPRIGRRSVPETVDAAAHRGQVDIALGSVLSDAGLRRSEAAALT